MSGGGDVFSTLGWGLRRYFWVVIVTVIGIGVLVPWLQSRNADYYEAHAQIGPSQELKSPNADPLPKLGDDIFNNGAVADKVRDYLNLPPTASVVPERVQLMTARDNMMFEVIGRDRDPEVAATLANLAAAELTVELSSESVSEFNVSRSAEAPASPVPTLGGGYLTVIVGLLAGAIAGIGVVALILIIRRPVMDAPDAEDATGAPVVGRIRLARPGGPLDERDVVGIALLCRRLLSVSPEVVLLASPHRRQSELRQVTTAMRGFFDTVRQPSTGANSPNQESSRLSSREESREPMIPELVLLDRPSLAQWTRPPNDAAFTLLVVPEGIGMRTLRQAADAYFTWGPSGLVIVSKHRRQLFRWRHTRSTTTEEVDTEPATATGGRQQDEVSVAEGAP